MHKLFITILTTLCVLSVHAQSGQGVFGFLDLPVSAHMTAYGGTNVAIQEADVSYGLVNPALLNAETHNMVSLNFADYISDIIFGSVAYGYNYKDNYFAAGFHFLDYGKFEGMSEIGLPTGEFGAQDFSLNLMYGRKLNELFNVGGTLKMIYSSYERYSSVGMAADIGAYFNTLNKLFSMGLVVKNIGGQLKPFYPGDKLEMAPVEVQLGMAVKFAHAPIRLSLNLHNLQRWNLGYQLTNQPSNSLTGETTVQTINFFDMALRHAIFAVDKKKKKNVYLTVAYNHRQMAEMKAAGFKSISGLSFGGGVKIYQFRVEFGMSQYQRGNFAYHFSLSTAINDFKKKNL